MTETHDYRIKAGNSRVFNITVEDNNNEILDLTGIEVIWQISDDPTEEPFQTYYSDTDDQLHVDDPEQGLVQIVLKPDDTKDLEYEYYHELLVREADDVSTVQKGWLFVTPSTSRNMD